MKSVPFLFLLMLFCGCSVTGEQTEPLCFERFFNWTPPNDEACAERYFRAGVTDVCVANRKQYDLAVKYNMTPFYGCFTPAGPHGQVVTPEEEKNLKYISGSDLPAGVRGAERQKLLAQRQREKNHRFGGPAVNPFDTLRNTIPCFISDKELKLSKAKIDKLLKKAPAGSAGICFDFLGYTNFRGCYCKNCLTLLQKFLREKKLKDTAENRSIFYRDQLVNYYNAMADYVKSKRPGYKVLAHFYPDFQFEPFYGNRTKVDFAGQTVAWYFKYPLAEVAANTRRVLAEANRYQPHSAVIPFLGLNTDTRTALGFKTPEELDLELKTILAAGARSLMICCGRTVSEPGYYEVFCKYSTRKAVKKK